MKVTLCRKLPSKPPWQYLIQFLASEVSLTEIEIVTVQPTLLVLFTIPC